MGQYYRPISLDKKECVSPYHYDNGAKLMEHSWIGNSYMRAVETLISKGGKWFGDKIVWAGDYADKELSNGFNDYSNKNLYDLYADNEIKVNDPVLESFKYLVNLDMNEFVDLSKVPINEIYDDIEFKIHPLSLLTCEGNGRGGGDFHGDDPKHLIGRWARKRVIAQNEKPENMRELKFNLK